MTSPSQPDYIIDLNDSIADIAENYVYDSEFSHLPAEIFQSLLFQAINDFIDDFSTNPSHYLKSNHESQLAQIASNYLDN